jgi:D-alanine-D-alanine ligase
MVVQNKHIAVLMGGKSAERQVSLSSGKEISKALLELGYKITQIDISDDVVQQLVLAKPDIVFNALHGKYGEDGCIQGLLEILEIPYTHSGVLASALAMDKVMAKKVFAAGGLFVAEDKILHKSEVIGKDPMKRPYVIKPYNEGSSVGVKLFFENDNFFFNEQNWHYGEFVMAERYIAGREITVAVLNGKALGVTEITTKGGFYDYDNKYSEGGSQHICPANLPKAKYDEVMEMAEKAHNMLGCKGLTRSDFRYDEQGDGKFYILELNTQPGMTPFSLSPEIAKYVGISFNELITQIINQAGLEN